MHSFKNHSVRVRFVLALLLSPLLTACAKSDIPVSIHGVNHSAEPFSFVLTDPSNKQNRGGGELIGSFGAGGTVCCYTLPAKWRPGLRVEIAETFWLPMLPDKTVPNRKNKHVLDIPPYADGKAGELWVMRSREGALSVVSSDFQPDHPRWPGKIKGWPIPSIEYQRQRHGLYLKEAEDTVDMYHKLIDGLEKDPAKRAQESWEHQSVYETEKLKGFSGPQDPAYRALLKREYDAELAVAIKELAAVKAARP